MQRDTKKLLEDIRKAALSIVSFVEDKSFDEYAKDDLLRAGVERKLEIVGEALNRLHRADPAAVAHIGDYRRIIDFRNILIHGYDIINNRIVWDVVQTRLPTLLAEVTALLNEE